MIRDRWQKANTETESFKKKLGAVVTPIQESTPTGCKEDTNMVHRLTMKRTEERINEMMMEIAESSQTQAQAMAKNTANTGT
ncbi:MAG: hypothetical protein A3J62_00245 [Candidatus Buchananbacteria bacterium RIFCSPHIGHO2_02_FULL_38_8]|uniref:Uncharacterized protein n=2 Tax=Candidatus Buchananiibacteriota TaxID=1817903 RepID=A0A1G1Y0N4_9BACT|nr:MAG: hypothetical protein A2731_03180 [Candidatus Buchananbacteria bacterium RIFCSPHIGHO2_01_FULL_39_8]OGY46819.1 MAG: hypothetical protein A3J62_00245 [Candidatus Buchananbacteria bacterium RIFCSPHIGHO2_02_FULL_38_8]